MCLYAQKWRKNSSKLKSRQIFVETKKHEMLSSFTYQINSNQQYPGGEKNVQNKLQFSESCMSNNLIDFIVQWCAIRQSDHHGGLYPQTTTVITFIYEDGSTTLSCRSHFCKGITKENTYIIKCIQIHISYESKTYWNVQNHACLILRSFSADNRCRSNKLNHQYKSKLKIFYFVYNITLQLQMYRKQTYQWKEVGDINVTVDFLSRIW